MTYEIVKSLHIISIIAWMAGMLYLPRLMVYHADATVGTEMSETFKVMERRLLKAIINPAMAASWLFGLWLVQIADYWSSGWMHAKFALILALTACHGLLARHVREFASDSNDRSTRYFRIINEVPTVLMIGIVFLVIFKPF